MRFASCGYSCLATSQHNLPYSQKYTTFLDREKVGGKINTHRSNHPLSVITILPQCRLDQPILIVTAPIFHISHYPSAGLADNIIV